ncbi:class I SAM-dependent methyltransferase [Miltoncostaea oceani]|uniref:class I SAM-dependent methyltransferase n=1 Tax=Miltoncostaea oceani TaxID=2843216 RepID=UPI001C3CF517|nr:class I SAM-dependent methyltransferase [Miltoncostaea oceani]
MSTATPGYAAIYDPDRDFDSRYTRATGARVAERVAPGDRVLELGCATGLMSVPVAAAGGRVTGIDHAGSYLERARARDLPGARFVRAALEEPGWEDLAGDGFAHVLACNLLHEMTDPVGLLRRARDVLAPGGLVHVSLQNPLSIHRLVAVEMGLIADVAEVSENGHRYATRGVHHARELMDMAWRAGLATVAREGVMLKPLPNAMMEGLPDEVLDGFERAARHLPDHCAMTYLVLRAR